MDKIRIKIERLEAELAQVRTENEQLRLQIPAASGIVAAEAGMAPRAGSAVTTSEGEQMQKIISNLNHNLSALSAENMHLQKECTRLLSARPTGLHDRVLSMTSSELEDLRMQVTR